VEYTPHSELKDRLIRLQRAMSVAGLEAVLIMENMDMYYFTGTAQAGYVWVPASGLPVLMVRKDQARAALESRWNPVPVRSLRDLPSILGEAGLPVPAVAGLEMDVLPVREFWRIQQQFPAVKWEDASGLIRRVRSVKSPYELSILRECGKLHDNLFAHIPRVLTEGIPETTLAAELESFLRRQGHQGYVNFRGFNLEMHYGHILAGPQGAVASSTESPTGGLGLGPAFPFSVSRHAITRNVPVGVDYVGRYHNYLVDQTRIYVIGELDPELQRAHGVALDIQEEIAKRAVPGVSCGSLYQLAVEMAQEAGLQDHFMGWGNQVSFIGHGLGLELNELPVLARGVEERLEEGMVVAVEPKFIFPNRGVVGIENTFVVTAAGLERLTCFQDEVIAVP